MRYLLPLLILCLASCSQSARIPGPLSDQEQAAIDYINKDQFMSIKRIERIDAGELYVVTQQGNRSVAYRVNVHASDKISEQIELVPLHVVYRKR